MKVNIDSVLRNLDLPSDVVEYFPKISIISNLRLLIENHKGIKLYTEKEIIVKCKKFNIEISGSELFIREITDEYIYIFGIVENINVQIDESYAYNSETDEFQTVFSQCDGIAKGITIKGNVTCIYDDEDEDVSIGAIEGNGTLMDSSIAITYDLQSEKTIEEIAEDIVENDLEFEFCQLGTTYTGITYQNCIGYGQYSEAIKSLADELEPKIEDNTWGNLCVSFTRKSFF